ncbi:MAG: LamB/YcsF family protein [Verrucomicrobia bacterium]|nr:LamB/YcsF family protein [Verrucomicrobiota bacterium]
MLFIDLNCDLGEGAGRDAALMPLVTSANIACGGHAGDEISMRATVALAQRHGVAVGAHPGFNDRANFGRKEWKLSPAVIYQLVTEQVATLARFAPVRHVKPHGALYNLAARDPEVAGAIASAVAGAGGLILYALAGSELVRAGRRQGVRVAEEVFADRTYRSDGSLTPRHEPNALITDEAVAVAQVLRMVREGTVQATDGTEVPIVADTVCVHGDGVQAVEFARRLREELAAAGVTVRALTR